MAKLTSEQKDWKKRQPRGAIMKPSTFKHIAATAKGKGGRHLSAARRRKVAGKAYQRTLQSKFRGR